MFETKPGEPSGGSDHRGTGVACAVNRAKSELQNHALTALLTSIALSLLTGFLISRRRHLQQRREWAGLILKQLNEWLAQGGYGAAVPIQEGVNFAVAAAKDISNKGVEYGRRISPFHRKAQPRVLGIF